MPPLSMRRGMQPGSPAAKAKDSSQRIVNLPALRGVNIEARDIAKVRAFGDLGRATLLRGPDAAPLRL